MRAENRSNLEQICVKLNLVLNEAHIYGECWYKIPPSSGLGEKNYRPVFRPGNNPSDHRDSTIKASTLAAQSKESVTKIEPLYAVDSTVLFMRMSVLLERSGNEIENYFRYELTPEPTSLFKENFMRKPNKIEHHAKVLSNQHGFLANDENKFKLIDQLTLRTKINDVIRINADACIYCNCFGSLMDIAVCGANVIVVSNDTYVKIMLLYLYNSEMGDIIVKSFGSKKRRSPDIDIGKTSNSLNPHVLKYLLAIQAFSGCDATSAIFDQGKTSIIKLIEKSKKARNFCDILMPSDSTVKEVGDPGIGLLVLMY
ncbi:hypothetical protein GQR58_017809 [Nymphon striatum]|nr:hypothetical protein GQR58_018778 [Nymphon striatum]KAG1668559.1 hypothetical protein GQR58_017809 [Nymphon striatum]